VGKTLVSSSMIDHVAADLGRALVEVPVGFKWFVGGLVDGSFGFGGEESAGASFLRRDGSVWTTDKDGIILCLLASEILAVTGDSPSTRYAALTERFGTPAYARVDAPATREEKAVLASLSPEQVTATELAGEPITATSPRLRATARPSAGSRCAPPAAGSPPARRGPRTSTRSTPRASTAPSTSPGSRPRLARWCAAPWRVRADAGLTHPGGTEVTRAGLAGPAAG
jgi:hypothetical protein